MDIAFLFFHLEDIFYYSHPQDGKASRLSCFFPAYLCHLLPLKAFERIILSRLLFFLESNSILSPRQAGFHPGQCTLDQILFLSQSISDGFNKPRPGSRTIHSTIDFSKAFDSIWHPALFHKLISAGPPPSFSRWTQSFVSDRRACVVYQNHKSRSSQVRRGVSQGFVLGSLLFSLFINDLRASMSSSVSCCLSADDLVIWSSFPRSPPRWRPHKELCFDWSAGQSTGVFLSIRANVRPPSSWWIPTKLTSNAISSYSAPASVSTPLQLFSGSPSTALFPFSKHVSLLKAKLFPRLKALRCISASSWGPSKESLSLFCINLFFGPFPLMLHPDSFLS